MKKYQIIILIIVIILFISALVYCSTYPFKNAEFEQKEKYREADYVKAYCNGQIEYRLPDKTRVDCLTEEYAIEFDWAKKWAESIGQSLYYAKMTGKKPAVAIILKSEKDKRYIERIKKVDQNITIFEIKAQEYYNWKQNKIMQENIKQQQLYQQQHIQQLQSINNNLQNIDYKLRY